ncbi:cytochrome p450 [Moniliophthora roreri MCA 2997]|uniref:Cytochrome p450 n=1 Tax=Moniliophthora roreri (strain MCA 2997) TaxID=1381753 RepID=V2XCP5_MONRO|nr:cytochrome p450 [Moniliophthora roreri MCA 2997]
MPSSILILLVVTAFLGWFLTNKLKRNPNLPPGPTAEPLLGHLRLIPSQGQAETFHQWAKIYGDVMYLKVFGREMVVLDSFETAQELLEKRGAKYSCRPRFVIYEIQGWIPSLTFFQYGDKRYPKHRKILQQYFGRRESLAFQHVLAEEASLLAKNLMFSGKGKHFRFVHRFTTSNIMRAAFGHPIKSDDDIFLKLGMNTSHVMNHSGPPGNTPVDFFPWLRHFPSWFPGTYYAFKAREGHKTIRQLYDIPIQHVEDQMRENAVERCFASDKLKELRENEDSQDPEKLTLDDVKGAAATIFSAGEDTSYATLTIFVLAMILHPECQKRVYEEIQSLIGHDRLPELKDREALPYLECVLQETLRWHPTLTLGVPHRVTEDDIYQGMLIPSGTVVIPNVEGMSLDERVYANPKTFDPSRFLPKPQGRGEPYFTAVWGFGRRICPGRHFADIAVWHAMASVLATLEIRPAEDDEGNAIFPQVVFTDGLISQAVPFDFQVRPRSEAAQDLLAQIDA